MKIFISAVSSEFRRLRADVAKSLRTMDYEVRDQEYFRNMPGTLLELLEHYIAECDEVIIIAGWRSGFMAEGHGVPVTARTRSYTQWEYYLAEGERLNGSRAKSRRIRIYFASEKYEPKEANGDTPDGASLQKDHRNVLLASNRQCSEFTSAHEMQIAVLEDLHVGSAERTHKPSNLPYGSLGSLFKGREETLARLKSLFDSHKICAIVIHGLGGIGKTRIAVEYAHANRDEFTAILYVSADSPQSIDTNIAGLCSSKALDLPQQTEAEAKLQYDAVKQWLRTNTDWLLIFDNADTEEAAQAVQRVTAELGPSGNILITSRLSNWPVHIKPLRIDQLSVNDAVDYLLSATASQRRETEGDEADATTLANVLGNLPLALSHAAAYIRRHTITFAQYLSGLEERREAVLSWNDPRLTDYPNSVLATWDTSFQQLSGEAKKLQQILSWFAPDPIPASIIENDVPDVVGSPGIASAMLEEALVELAGYSLITQDTISPQFSVHRLVQEVTRISMSADVRDATLGQALNWLDTLFVGDLQDPKSWPRLLALAPHVENLSTNTLAPIVYPQTVSLLDRCAILFQYRGNFGAAEPLFRLAFLLYGASFGPSDPTVATATHNLAMVLYATGRFAEAENLYQSALFLYENCYGPGHPHVATALDNLANLLKTTNRPMEAEPLYQRSLAIREEFYGPDHPDVAQSLYNYGGLLKTTNHLVEAEQMFTRGLAINARTFGDDDPSVATGLDNLAGVFSATNRAAEAEPMYRRAAAMREARYGPTHITVATSLNSLGLLLTANNSLVEAESLFRRALEINVACYGPEHPEVAVELNNLARVLRRTGRLREAEPMYRRAIAIDEASYGPDHPEVATNLNNLGVLLREMGRPDEVESLFARALEIRESSYGPDHPDVAQSLNNLAGLLQATNRLTEAEPLSRRHVEIFVNFTRATGHKHPNLEAALHNYAGLLNAMGKSDDEIVEMLRDIAPEML